jgi:hypothetical protein
MNLNYVPFNFSWVLMRRSVPIGIRRLFPNQPREDECKIDCIAAFGQAASDA